MAWIFFVLCETKIFWCGNAARISARELRASRLEQKKKWARYSKKSKNSGRPDLETRQREQAQSENRKDSSQNKRDRHPAEIKPGWPGKIANRDRDSLL